MDASHRRVDGPHQPPLASGPERGDRGGHGGPATPDLPPLRLVLQPTGAVIEVTRSEAVVGRHSEADVRLPLPDVSRRHCRLHYVEGCWQVVDLHSLNGVYVNGEQVLQAPLRQGDLLRVGGFTFSVDLGEDTTPVHPFPASLSAMTLEHLNRKAS